MANIDHVEKIQVSLVEIADNISSMVASKELSLDNLLRVEIIIEASKAITETTGDMIHEIQ